MVSIFKNPQRLGRLLASVKVDYRERPLTPIEAAKELDAACKELGGDKKEAQKRFMLSPSMWAGFERLLTLSPNIQDIVIWGASDKELGLGFTVAHLLARFESKYQELIVQASWENKKPIRKEELKKMYTWHNDNPNIPMEQIIADTLSVSRPIIKQIILFLSGLKPSIYTKLSKDAKEANTPLADFTKNVLLKKFSENSISSVNPSPDFIRITFSGEGRKELQRMMEEFNVSKNDIINHIFEQEGYN